MDADNCYFSRRPRGERAAAESAINPVEECAHLELAMRFEQLGHAPEAHLRAASVTRVDHGPEKFGAEEHALYDFRDYGLD